MRRTWSSRPSSSTTRSSTRPSRTPSNNPPFHATRTSSMSIEVKVPVLPESVSDATIAAWHKKAGDTVRRDENLLDLETDKVVLEVPSPVDGVLKELKFQAGDTVTSQQVVAIIEEGAGAAAPAPAAAPAKAAAAAAPAAPAKAAAPA